MFNTMRSACMLILIFTSLAHSTDLFQAIDSGYVEQVTRILEENPELLDVPNSNNLTPLNLAASRGQVEMVRNLLALGADATIGDNENSQPLHNAAVGGHIEVIDMLLAHGVDINVQDDNGMTPLMFAVSRGHPATVDYLLDKNASLDMINTIGRSVFEYAIWGNQIEIAERLVQSGLDVNKRLSAEWTPIIWTIRNDNLEMIKMFVSNGAKLDVASDLDETYLHYAVFFEKREIVEYFLDNGISVNSVKRGNLTPLHIAAVVGYVDLAALLIERGADLNIKSTDGGTPLHFAQAARNREVVNLLKSKGAEDNPRNFPVYQGKYLGAREPGDDPEPFVSELFLDIYRVHSAPQFSPDGKEVYWEAMFMRGVNNASRMWYMKEEDGVWQAPQVAPFADYPCGGPVLSSDGKTLIYHSLRPRDADTGLANDLDLWVVERTGEDWSEPIHLDAPVSADGTWEVSPHLADDGTMYLRKGDRGYIQYGLVDGKYIELGEVGDFFDTEYIDSCQAMEYIILYSDRRQDRFHFELFISYHRPDGGWTEPVYMGDRLHQGVRAAQGQVSLDGKWLFFVRNFSHCWMDAGIIDELRPAELK